MTNAPIGDAKRIQVTSFGADNATDASTEWVVAVSDTRIGFWTPDITGWEARTATSPVVSVHQCDSFGKVDREQPVFEGRVQILTSGEIFDEVKRDTKGKYAVGAFVAGVVDKVKELGGDETPEGVVLINIVG